MSRKPTQHTALRGENSRYVADLIQRKFGATPDMETEFQRSATPAGARGAVIVYSDQYAILFRLDSRGVLVVWDVIAHGLTNPMWEDIRGLNLSRFSDKRAELMGGVHPSIMEGAL